MPLGLCKHHRGVAEATHQFRLSIEINQLEGSSQADEFVGCLAAADPLDLPGHKFGLAFAREPARHPAPENVFLALDAPTGKTRAIIMHPPQGATLVALTVPEMVGVAWLVVPPVVDIVTVGSVSATVTAWLTSVETWP